MAPWSIRPAKPEDVPALIEMLVGWTPWRELGYDATRCRALVADHLHEVTVAVGEADRPVGFVRWRPNGVLGQPYLHLLAVAPEQQRAGVGSALMGWLEAEVFDRQRAANLFLCVSAFNHPARRFYASRGYVEVGVLTDYLRSGMDEVLLRKSRRPLLAGED